MSATDIDRDSNHGISRDAIAFRLRTLEDGQREIVSKVTEIAISIAKIPSSCQQADRCADVFADVERLKLEKATADGKITGGKVVIGAVWVALGSVASMAWTYFQAKK